MNVIEWNWAGRVIVLASMMHLLLFITEREREQEMEVETSLKWFLFTDWLIELKFRLHAVCGRVVILIEERQRRRQLFVVAAEQELYIEESMWPWLSSLARTFKSNTTAATVLLLIMFVGMLWWARAKITNPCESNVKRGSQDHLPKEKRKKYIRKKSVALTAIYSLLFTCVLLYNLYVYRWWSSADACGSRRGSGNFLFCF